MRIKAFSKKKQTKQSEQNVQLPICKQVVSVRLCFLSILMHVVKEALFIDVLE